MANELEILDNPTSTPEAVSTGYQRQNTLLVAARAGLDCSVLETSGLSAILKTGGPVDVNGVLYSIVDDATLTPPVTGRYFIRLAGTGDNLTPELTTSAGTFDPVKNARYDGDGYRLLNWIVYSDGAAAYISRLLTPENERNIAVWDEPEEWNLSQIGGTLPWVAPRSKYYDIIICGKGGDGGAADGDSGFTTSGGDGGGGATGFARVYIEAGEAWTATFNITLALVDSYTRFSNGVITLEAQNGNDGTSGDTGGSGSNGPSGTTAPGCDRVEAGEYGSYRSYLNQYRKTAASSGTLYYGADGDPYGMGAQGGRSDGAARTGGTGGAGLVRIRG
jgi:hypothetical protein